MESSFPVSAPPVIAAAILRTAQSLQRDALPRPRHRIDDNNPLERQHSPCLPPRIAERVAEQPGIAKEHGNRIL